MKVTLEKAQANFADLIHRVSGGDEFIITVNGEPKGKLIASPPRERCHPKAGSLQGKIWMSPDFEAPLYDFKDYMK
jgi:prevent-host-death family protein